MSNQFQTETAIHPTGPNQWTTDISSAWNIGDNPNGGYLLTSALRAAQELSGHPDPLTVTTHFFRPGIPDEPAEITAEVLKGGRTISTVRATLTQQGAPRLTMIAGFGDISATTPHDVDWAVPCPSLPPPEACIDRAELTQGIAVALNSRSEIRVDPASVHPPDDGAEAEITGWTRFRDGSEPTVLSLPFFADAFPPTVFTRLGPIGWVPTLELTVHVRRRPAPGWLVCQVWCDDVFNGKMIETVRIWDRNGDLVAQARQLGLLI
jgi:acyl-CoA thioesterase